MKKTPKKKTTKQVSSPDEIRENQLMSRCDGFGIIRRQAIEEFDAALVLLTKETLVASNKAGCCKSCAQPLPMNRKNVCHDCLPQYLTKDDLNVFC